MNNESVWPDIPFQDWAESCATLQLWTQIVGKIRLSLSAWVNHSWHVTLYVSPNGLTTSPIFYEQRMFQIEFDFLNHRLLIWDSNGNRQSFKLEPMTVADFYAKTLSALDRLGIDVSINTMPNEIPGAAPFTEDTRHASYDPVYVNRFWRALVQTDRVMQRFRACFTGKCSPVHFFWGGFDLAVTRFSGRVAPEHPGGIPNLPDAVTREAYDREVSSAGFWPGGGPIDYPAFYSYAYPKPDGFEASVIGPEQAFWDKDLGEFLLPYDAVRTAADPDQTLWLFLQSTYKAAANGAAWDRQGLERVPVAPR